MFDFDPKHGVGLLMARTGIIKRDDWNRLNFSHAITSISADLAK
jgi:hypothetical protein